MSEFTPDQAYVLIKDHYLEPVENTGSLKAFYLRDKPNTRIQSTLIMFTPEGIVITGDLCPGRNGVIGRGYGLEWFASELSPSYLAEKFLCGNVYDPDRAERRLKEYLSELGREAWQFRDIESIRQARNIRDAIKEWSYPFESPESLHDCLGGLISDQETLYGFGYGYPVVDFAWLSAIQRRFAETYLEMKSRTVNPVGGRLPEIHQ